MVRKFHRKSRGGGKAFRIINDNKNKGGNWAKTPLVGSIQKVLIFLTCVSSFSSLHHLLFFGVRIVENKREEIGGNLPFVYAFLGLTKRLSYKAAGSYFY